MPIETFRLADGLSSLSRCSFMFVSQAFLISAKHVTLAWTFFCIGLKNLIMIDLPFSDCFSADRTKEAGSSLKKLTLSPKSPPRLAFWAPAKGRLNCLL